MKPHIVIPLLVVCVGLPLVALGMYYLCESMPIAEDMRKREAQSIAERRQARGNDNFTTYDEEDATNRATQTSAVASNDGEKEGYAINRASQTNVVASNGGKKVEIKGVSINLPFEQLVQELGNKFGGIARAGKVSFINEGCVSLGFVYLPDNFKWSSSRPYVFKEPTAFGGEICVFENGCVRIAFLRGHDGGDLSLYEKELQKKYGNGEKIESSDVIQGGPYKGQQSTDIGIIRILDDGLIIVEFTDAKHPHLSSSCVFYFGKSVRDAYLKDKNEWEQKQKMRDAGGI